VGSVRSVRERREAVRTTRMGTSIARRSRRSRRVGMGSRRKCFGGHRGCRCENHANGEKHRTEVTEATEGDLGSVAQALR
jgi:hypothetical protein